MLTSRVSIGNPYVSAMCMETSAIPLNFCRTKNNSSMTSINPLYAFSFSLTIKTADIRSRAPTTINPPDATATDVPAIPVTAAITSGLPKAVFITSDNVVMTVTPTDVWIAADATFVMGC